MADGRHVWKYYKCHNSLTNGPTETQLGWSDPIISSTCPPRFGCHRNGRCLATAHGTYCSYGRLEAERRTREPISIKFGTQQHVRSTVTVTWLNIKICKIQNGGRPPCWKIFEMTLLDNKWTDWDANWMVTCHYVPDMSPMMLLPW